MTSSSGSYWTPARMAYLRQLADGTNSADVIAAALGGITRNAVIGKICRTEGLRLRTLSVAGLERARKNREANPEQKRREPQRRIDAAPPRSQDDPAPSSISLPPIELEEDEEWPPFVGLWKVDTPPEVLRLYQLIGENPPAELIGHPQAAGVRKGASR